MLATGVIAGKSLDLSLEVPPTSAESLRALWPELMLAAPLSGTLRLAGISLTSTCTSKGPWARGSSVLMAP